MPDRPRRLLLVDANDQWRVAWAAELATLGWIVDEAQDVRTAIDSAIRLQPQVILTNTHLPDANGYHFVRTLRGVVEDDVVVVGLVTSTDVGDNIARAGFDFILREPFDFSVFRRKGTDSTEDDDRPTLPAPSRRNQ